MYQDGEHQTSIEERFERLNHRIREGKELAEFLRTPGGELLLKFLDEKIDIWRQVSLTVKNKDLLWDGQRETLKWMEIRNFLLGGVEQGNRAEDDKLMLAQTLEERE